MAHDDRRPRLPEHPVLNRSRPEEPVGTHLPEYVAGPEEKTDPEQQALLADSVGLALLVVLDTLTPAERLAFVLHDMFDVPFDEIALIIERSPGAARQLASRARRRVRGAEVTPATDPSRQRDVVAAFLTAARGGRFDALLALLDPDVVLRADPAAVQLGTAGEIRGAAAVAEAFTTRLGGAQPVLIDGTPGAMWAPGGRPRVVFNFSVSVGRITAVELVADPKRLRYLELVTPDSAT